MIGERILHAATLAREYLDAESRRAVIRFVRTRLNSDGGVRGRDERSDLYYTLFAAMCMRALGGRMPLFRLWRYLQSFKDGTSLDAVHLFCLIRLRLLFPMLPGTRRRLAAMLESMPAESAYDLFFKVLSADFLKRNDRPDELIKVSASQTTPDLAAAVVINGRTDPEAEVLLMERYSEHGGFRASAAIPYADLLSTATALFALQVLQADLASIRGASFDFIESLWRDNGGFAGYAEDQFEDVEYTFYALLSIGCLME